MSSKIQSFSKVTWEISQVRKDLSPDFRLIGNPVPTLIFFNYQLSLFCQKLRNISPFSQTKTTAARIVSLIIVICWDLLKVPDVFIYNQVPLYFLPRCILEPSLVSKVIVAGSISYIFPVTFHTFRSIISFTSLFVEHLLFRQETCQLLLISLRLLIQKRGRRNE